MRTIGALFVVFGLTASLGAERPDNLGFDPQAIVKAYVKADERGSVEFKSFSPPVKAESCRIFDRTQGSWRPVEKSGVALHVRYTAKSPYGLDTVKSEVFFIGLDGVVWKTIEASGVRSRDPALFK
jgi:hypothetical protein